MQEPSSDRTAESNPDSTVSDESPAQTGDETDSTSMDLLRRGAHQLGVPLTPHQIEQLERYFRALVLWNQKFNLTAITDSAGVQVKHFLDCLSALPIVAEELQRTLPLTADVHLVDVGTGAGFPGLPLKIACPDLSLTLMDGTGKKIRFLRTLVDELGLPGVTLVQGRAEELGRQDEYRQSFDLVTARAVAPLQALVEYLLPLVRLQGFAVVYKGSGAPQEFIEARKAIELLGGETTRLAPVQVPFLDEQRFVLLVKKVRPTPGLYPRGQGLPRKKPLG